MSVGTRNRLVYLMAGCATFIELIKTRFALPVTGAYTSFLDEYEEKFACIDHDFYRTPVMTSTVWRGPHQKQRHIFTRLGAHGFHFELCMRVTFHEAEASCECKYCHLPCAQYHFITCINIPYSLTQVANRGRFIT